MALFPLFLSLLLRRLELPFRYFFYSSLAPKLLGFEGCGD